MRRTGPQLRLEAADLGLAAFEGGVPGRDAGALSAARRAAWWLGQPWMAWLVAAFQDSALDIAGTADERTLILEMFVYVGLLFTLLTIPFLQLLRRELERRDIAIDLGPVER